MKKILKFKKILLIFLPILVLGILIWLFVFKKEKKVESFKVERGTVYEELILSGQISADEYAKLYFPTSGQIAWVGVKEGQEVKKGSSLLKLDTTVLNTAFQQAKANLRASEATLDSIYDQLKNHEKDETFSQKDTRTAAEAAKDRAYEAYIAAEYNLRNATIKAPFSGVVTYLAHTYPGVNVSFSEPQVEIVNPETVYYDVSADQTEVTEISVGQKVNIILDSYPDEVFEGEVIFISFTPKVGEVGTVYKVKVGFKEKIKDFTKFRIGMSGDAKFILSEKKDVLYVPPKFIKTDSKGKYLIKGKKNNRVYVEVGVEGEDRVEVKGDIKEGDIVYD